MRVMDFERSPKYPSVKGKNKLWLAYFRQAPGGILADLDGIDLESRAKSMLHARCVEQRDIWMCPWNIHKNLPKHLLLCRCPLTLVDIPVLWNACCILAPPSRKHNFAPGGI